MPDPVAKRRRPGRRHLLRGTLELLALTVLDGGPSSGWEIGKEVFRRSNGVLAVTPGTVYPVLQKLEAAGAIRAQWSRTRLNRRARIYRLTLTGRTRMREAAKEWHRFVEGTDAVLTSN